MSGARKAPVGVVVAQVRTRTAAERAGLCRGDRILTINGAPLRDVIDFHFQSGDSELELELDRNGRTTRTVLRRQGSDMGLELEPPRPTEIATCANKCVFCFIHQLPRGMRRSLYVKDDDFRLSFLHGNYITLTDLDEEALTRIEAQRLSPLYISVHATDPDLRHRLLGEPRTAREIMPRLERLARAGITLHTQIVLCPGWNDGAHLERSVRELAALYPRVSTVAVVPVGLTRHRDKLPRLRSLEPDEARALIPVVERWQWDLHARLGSRFVFLADEIYLLAGAAVPSAASYEGFPVIEDGIGLVRRFYDRFARMLPRLPASIRNDRDVTVVTGQMFAPLLRSLLERVQVRGLSTCVIAVTNECFGPKIQVAGLLTGQDIQSQLAGRPLGHEVLIPDVALRDRDGVFLDDLTPQDLSEALRVPVRSIRASAEHLLAALVGQSRT